ncbi:ankyrin repeat containing protein [Pseudozyma hubeiensis SY62]|uniref:Ankyrin repeat containing protein n=1 Tax=Pseudozyma hubeiensis (strain SY62) TaxID=1305764 RepID=R9PD15_PSEHS|nr:ankyrin repeat containing protein [Pseudozyma hubeiensis SY62]GAC99246.1 ankyrin repeat containing protein [Pseudozyma hubeiensis SY62]
MPELPVAAPKELRIDTAAIPLVSSTNTDDDLPAVEAAQLSPKVDRVRHHLIPARTNTCVRAPCLKRQASVPISSIIGDLAAARREGNHNQDRVASNPLPTSFAAPRNLVLHHASRHVHFDEAPPEEFYVLSGASYDRRPIKCTQGGSEFDMSLPPRSTSYNGDDSNDDDASSTDDGAVAMEPAEEPAPDVGFIRDPTLENWACIKNGTVIASVGYQPRQQQSGLMASGKSLHFSALSSLQHASALNGGANAEVQPAQPQPTSQKVSLPVHGFRSFGGLQNSLAPEVTAADTSAEQSISSENKISSLESIPPAVRTFSPDATPMPSPSLHRSIGAFASLDYFVDSSKGPSSAHHGASNLEKLVSNGDAAQLDEEARESIEILRDAPISNSTASGQDFCVRDASPNGNSGLRSPTPVRPPAAVVAKVSEAAAHSTPRRIVLERRTAERDAVRISSLGPPSPALINGAAPSPGWSSLLGIASSPLSSRCSSVDPWSSLSSDGDGDGTESPCNETSWISSNCTSPDLGPFDQVNADAFHNSAGPHAPSGSNPSWMEARSAKQVHVASALRNGAASHGHGSVQTSEKGDRELMTPKTTAFAEDAKLSSSVETIDTSRWEHKHLSAVSSTNILDGISSGEVSAAEATTPESSRRPSFHKIGSLSPRLRTSRGGEEDACTVEQFDDDDSRGLRVRSLSRDGHSKKKSTKCRYCRSLRQRLKASGTESSAPTSSGGSAQITDAEEEGEDKSRRVTLTEAGASYPATGGSAEVSEVEDEDLRSRSSLSQLRASVRSLSVDDWSSNASRSRSRDGSALSHLSRALDSQHDRESSNSPAESSSESPHLLVADTPMVCTCDKKREKERLKKKVRKEREMERERDREWERDQARGRQMKLFGESFGDADTSCLSALDGF